MTRQILIATGALALMLGVPLSASAHPASANPGPRPLASIPALHGSQSALNAQRLVIRDETAQHGRGGRAFGARPRGGGGTFGSATPRTVAPFRRRFFARPFFFSPFAFGGFGLGFAYDPFFWGGYGWGYPYWGYPSWGYGPYYGYGYGYGHDGQRGYDRYGSVKLDVKPSNAEVYADGYYMGQVRDFDGAFHHLDLTPGEHKIEIRANGYQPLALNMKIAPGRTVNYRGDLQRGSGAER